MRKDTKKLDAVILAVLLLLTAAVIAYVLFVYGRGSTEQTAGTEYSDYNGRSIGVVIGTSYEDEAYKYFPDSRYVYFNSVSDAADALYHKKIDGFIIDEPAARRLTMQMPFFSCIGGLSETEEYAFGFGRDSARSDMLRNQFDLMLAEMEEDGTLRDLGKKWLGADNTLKTVDLNGFSGENGELHVVLSSLDPPFSYTKNDRYIGMSVEMIEIFCRRYGYEPIIEDQELSAQIAGLASGKYDICASPIAVTEERSKIISFSETFHRGNLVLAVRNPVSFDAVYDGGSKGIVADLKKGFYKCFAEEHRWKLVVNGVVMTCLITLISVIPGTLLAFLICLFRRTESRLAGKISDVFVGLMKGSPAAVLLMLFYYVVFGNTGVSSLISAGIVFTMYFGAYASEIMRAGIESVDKRQYEAALALGFDEKQAFFGYVFPQAAVKFFPAYSEEVISLLKNTSVVGFIALQDLTKMSDILRSRTYEAFVPLISVLIIYILLIKAVSALLGKAMKKIDPAAVRRGAVK